MKPQVRMIEGLHLTATDKQNILDAIEWLRRQERLDHPAPVLRRPGSPKGYALAPHKDGDAVYSVMIKARETASNGRKHERTSHYVVEVRGAAPLPWDRLLGTPPLERMAGC